MPTDRHSAVPRPPPARGGIIAGFRIESGTGARQSALVSSEDHTGSEPTHTLCQNCGATLQGPFCHACGQHDFEFHQSFHHVVHEALETWFHVDRSFLSGFYELVFQPGRMTREFNAGQRARHVPPLRFYLVISLLFFLTVSQLPLHLSFARVTVGDVSVEGRPDELRPHAPAGTFQRRIEEQLIASLREPGDLLERFVHRLPKAMAVCVPLFALFSRALYWRGPWRYLQHLILAVHLHTFFFLWVLVVSGYAKLAGLAWPLLGSLLGWAGAGYAVYYFFAALRYALGTTRWTAFWKGTVLAATYGFVLGAAVASTLVLSVVLA
jgi:hypothetical protein